MKKKRIVLIIVCLVLIGIIVGVILLINSIKKEKETMLKNMEVISELYDDFIDNVESVDEIRNDFYNMMSKEIYLSNLEEKKEELLNVLNSHKKVIEKIKENNDELEKLCKYNYTNSEINTKCTNYKDTYDLSINVYNSAVNSYNTLINEYNQFINDKEKELDLYND